MNETMLMTMKLQSGDKPTIDRVLAAVRKAKGNAVHAAADIGVSHRTMCRWLKIPVVAKAVEKARASA